MLDFIIMLIILTVFTRIYLNKFDTHNKNKDIIAIAISIVLAGTLNFIQLILNFILNSIF